MTRTRSQSAEASSRSWVMKSIASPLSPQGVEDRHDLGLDGHVERRRRFVGDEDVRVGGQLPAIITRWSMPPDSSPGYER